MGSEKITEDTTTTAPAKDDPALVKKIGRTTYIVRVHFSKTSKETKTIMVPGQLFYLFSFSCQSFKTASTCAINCSFFGMYDT